MIPPAGAIDEDKKKSGWAVGGATGKNHSAVFDLVESLTAEAGVSGFKIVLSQHYGGGHTIGRFRISAMTGVQPDPMLPDEIREILAISPDAPGGEPDPLVRITGAAWVIGAVSMPTVCFLASWRQPLRHLFFIPVLAMLAGGGLTTWVVLQGVSG